MTSAQNFQRLGPIDNEAFALGVAHNGLGLEKGGMLREDLGFNHDRACMAPET